MAVDMFLKIDGIDGEAQSHKHKGEIELLSFSWGLSQTVAAPGSGGGSGKVQVSDFSIIKQIDAASPHLMEACCRGEHIRDVTMTLATKTKGQDYLVVKLNDCLITSYQTSGGGAGGALPAEQVSFNFSSVQVQAADKNGRFVTDVSCNFAKFGDGQVGHDH